IASRDSSPIGQVLERKQLDRLGAIPQASIMLEASTGFYFGDDWTGPETRDADKDYHGTHGYLPSKLEMRSSLVVYGQGARPGAQAAGGCIVDNAHNAAGGSPYGLREPTWPGL